MMKATAQIRSIFAERYKLRTPDDRLALAKALYTKALETNDNAIDRYALLVESKDLAVSVGDLAEAWRALDKLCDEFEVDALEIKQAAIKGIVAGRSSAEQLAQRYAELIELAARDERYETAQDLTTAAVNVVVKAKLNPLAQKFQERGRALKEQKKAYDAAQAARKTLDDSPDNAAANHDLGSYLCFWRHRWAEGLPYLSKSNVPKLREAAQLDRGAPTAADEQRAAGDAWLAAVDGIRGAEKEVLVQRASYWYHLALPQLNGLEKLELEKKLQTLPQPGPAAVSPKSDPA
jgi:hypothetical protein